MKIDYLANWPDLVPVIAGWFLAHWADFYRDQTREQVEQSFLSRLKTNSIPLALVALDDEDHVVGTVSLLEESIPSHRHWGPWLGGLYVDETLRGQGVGSALVKRAVEVAGEIGIGKIYTAIHKSEDLYEALGWSVIERSTHDGKPITILMRSILESSD